MLLNTVISEHKIWENEKFLGKIFQFFFSLFGMVILDRIWIKVFDISVQNKCFILYKLQLEQKVDETFFKPPKSLGKFIIRIYDRTNPHF